MCNNSNFPIWTKVIPRVKINSLGIIFIVSIIIANFLNKGCLYLVDKFDLISDSARLGVLFIPFIIYGIILFVIVPYVIKLINKNLEK